MAFVNPIGRGLRSGRVDMGVDYSGTGSLYAMGSGTIVNVYNAGWPGGTFIGLHLDSGQYMYYAEDIKAHVSKGQRVQAGDLIGTATGGGIEVGWAAPPGSGETMAAAHGQAAKGSDPGAHPTGYGVNMSDLIKSLGGPGGITSGPITGGVPANFMSTQPQTASAMPGCVPLIAHIYRLTIAFRVMKNALCHAPKLGRYISRRKQGHRRRQDEKRN